MADEVSKIIFENLCENQGFLEFRQVKDVLLKRQLTVHDSILLKVLSDKGKYAVQSATDIQPGTLVVARTQLRVCQEAKCLQCNKLHLCRYFICGNCRHGNKCKHSHDLASQHNISLLREAGLQNLPEKQLFQLLLQNDADLLPEICSHYNRGSGEHGLCKYPTNCINLHVCQRFLQGDCKFGAKCKKEHSFQVLKILKGRGLSDDNIKKLDEIYHCKFIINRSDRENHGPHSEVTEILPIRTLQIKSTTSDSATAPKASEADLNEICLYYLRQHCSFKEKCVRNHYQLPYRWQVQGTDPLSWTDMLDMEGIEEAYCNPKNTIKLLGTKVRRLSTVSSVSKPQYFILTTDWLWYWTDGCGSWVEYGQVSEGVGSAASVNSETLERVYLSEEEMHHFTAGIYDYTINFKEMYQQNKKTGTMREVRRRPRFVSTQNVQDKLRGISTPSGAASPLDNVVPDNWDKTALPNFGYKLIPLTGSSAEYTKVQSLFKCTMKTSVVNTIARVQNPLLWKVFQLQKTLMEDKNGGKPVDERHLFHGTEESLIDPICEQNFDWRMCGVHGTLYGKGSYFARDASYSHNYSRVSGGLRRMFVARVLVGEFTTGSSSYVRPPSRSAGSKTNLYDSCVNSAGDPSIFVVFEKQQIYPEYVIDYS